jgi:magnesium chelatase family protein
MALLGSPKIRLAAHLGQVLDFLRDAKPLAVPEPLPLPVKRTAVSPEMDRVLGNALAKRALQVALAGRHHLLLVGSPGVGKTLLAQGSPSLLPPLAVESWLQVLKNYVHAPSELPPWSGVPFRSPHHTISGAALLGGGSGVVVPGEVTLAHGGVLFLDEFPEFRKEALEGLREPMQNGSIHLHRIGHALTLPARFSLIAAMNPCPCGHSLGTSGRCRCTPERVSLYRRRISGPILDRFDLCVVVGTGEEGSFPGASHDELRGGIERAILSQEARFESEGRIARNGDTHFDLQSEAFALGPKERRWFDELVATDGVNYRSAFRSLRVARTLADIEGSDRISMPHLREAWSLRCPDSHAQLFGY